MSLSDRRSATDGHRFFLCARFCMKSRCGKNVIWLTVYAVLWRYRTLASSIFLYATHLDFSSTLLIWTLRFSSKIFTTNGILSDIIRENRPPVTALRRRSKWVLQFGLEAHPFVISWKRKEAKDDSLTIYSTPHTSINHSTSTCMVYQWGRNWFGP